jgi:AcrR family transcriptional regulator
MPRPKPHTRPYNSTRRRERARETRQEILATARALFLADGYKATTMAAIAANADVSVETLYGTWGSKAGLVRALLREGLRGQEDGPPLEQSEAIKAVIAEPRPRRQLELYGSLLGEIQPKIAPIVRLLREGASSDRQLAEAYEQHKRERLEAMQRFAALLQSHGALRRGLTVGQARDILWTLNSSDVYELLVGERGWSRQRYGRWIADALAAALLGPTRRGTS